MASNTPPQHPPSPSSPSSTKSSISKPQSPSSSSTASTYTSSPSSPAQNPRSSTPSPPSSSSPHLSANFASPQSHQVDYDHEVYLRLIAGENSTKTPNQIYREKLVRRQTTRALDLAVLDPVGQQNPSPVDLEWAESLRVRDRLVGG
ncbi:uncharacterized protein BO97DRAFT_401842 [Aspergillus homomorphus CBS 101889]|uniref:Uncharacterized protein n=1 Tax=Aspergillus homomorphus (strain CBS 101889) TaxID=1450537 RepID=A0A395IB09_ASPHC|nr:hypothetical protein BO97DRAFT_401842 [Aspergillus homomorphus CBS 101889]RAL17155.1 hypothetical protein BO97DRAFT_401842 [Aspergillus homomorphus CBS 101889]